MDRSIKYVLSDGVEWTEADGEIVVMDTANGLFFGMEQVGADLWRQIVEGNSLAEALAVLTDNYDVEPNQLADDCDQFVTSLVNQGLIKHANTSITSV